MTGLFTFVSYGINVKESTVRAIPTSVSQLDRKEKHDHDRSFIPNIHIEQKARQQQ